METFPETVLEIVGPVLKKHGFRVVRQAYHHEVFGNGYVDFQKGRVAVRVVRDRGQVAVEIGRAGWFKTEWHDMDWFLKAAHPDLGFEYETIDPDTQLLLDAHLQVHRVIEILETYLADVLDGDLRPLAKVQRLESEFVEQKYGVFLRKSLEGDAGRRAGNTEPDQPSGQARHGAG